MNKETNLVKHVLDSYGVEEFDGYYGVYAFDNLVNDLKHLMSVAWEQGYQSGWYDGRNSDFNAVNPYREPDA